MSRILNLITILFLLSIATSCDRPLCENTNPIFDKYSPETKEYKDELVNQLSQIDKSKLTYWMDTYQNKSNSEYMGVYIQGDGLCAKIVLVIKDSRKGIEDIIQHEGVSYVGAELEGLKFDITQDSVKTEFVFREVGNVVD
jgi:hypothetical protein